MEKYSITDKNLNQIDILFKLTEINNIDNYLTEKQIEEGWKFIFDGIH